MANIEIEILRADIKSFGNHFIVVLLQQKTYQGLIEKEQYRTEIEEETEFPVFQKNIFHFSNVILGNQISLQFGLFLTNYRENAETSTKELILNSSKIGVANILWTVDFISKLRKCKYLDLDLHFFHPEKKKAETGAVTFRITYTPGTLDVQIFDDNKEIEACYYDPFETNKIVIKEKLIEVINLNEEKQIELEEIFKTRDKSYSELKKAAFDLNNSQIEFAKLEKENELMQKRLNRLQNIDEIHIEIDLLNSEEGVEIMKKKYAVLCGQHALQAEYTLNMANEYKEIEMLMAKIRMVKERQKSLLEANNDLKFNIQRETDILPLISKCIEKTKANDTIIKSLHSSIEEINKLVSQSRTGNVEAVEKRLNELYKDRRQVEEKKIQMDLHMELFSNNDVAWEENFIKIIGHSSMMNEMYNERERFWIEQFKKKKLELEDIVKDLSGKLVKLQKENDQALKHTIVVDPGLRKRKIEIEHKIQHAERREQILMNESETSVMYYKSTISKLKDKIEAAEQYIDKEVAFAKRNYYKMNDDGRY